MKRICFLLTVVFSIMAATFPALADEGFYVIGMGAGVGVKIISLPKVITAPGFYYVTGNLSCPADHGITVNADNVTIDLMGFCLTGNSSSYGLTGTGKNVEVRNGSLVGWNHAVDMWGVQNRFINLRTRGGTYGINLGTNGGNLVKGCTCQYYSDTGIFATYSTISNNILTVASNSDYGIVGSGIISGNRLNGPHNIGIYCVGPANIIGNNVDSQATGDGAGGIVMSEVELWPTVLDQNTVYGRGKHYVGGTSATVWAGKSTYYPYGNNAGAPLSLP
jgi:hypothetical protein